jgi:nicotinate-nucleotide adenylyltransferase
LEYKLGVYGGSFDPVHKGHIYLAQGALNEFDLDKVLMMVPADPPHKLFRGLTGAEHRFNMVKLAIKGHDSIIASDLEMRREGATYTYRTLELVSEQYGPQTKLYLIMGEDMLIDLPRWKNAERIMQLSDIIAAARPGTEFYQAGRYDAFVEEYKHKIHIAHFKGPDISSTQVRERICAGRDVKDLITPEVEAYIRMNGLYSGDSLEREDH